MLEPVGIYIHQTPGKQAENDGLLTGNQTQQSYLDPEHRGSG